LFNRHSIIFKIQLLFLFSVSAIGITTTIIQIDINRSENAELFHKLMTKRYDQFDEPLERVSPELEIEILKNGEKIEPKPFHKLDKKDKDFDDDRDHFYKLDKQHKIEFEKENNNLNDQNDEFKFRQKFKPHRDRDHKKQEIILYESHIYFLMPNGKIFDSHENLITNYHPTFIGLAIAVLLSALLFFVQRSLQPLRNLEIAIRKFGDREAIHEIKNIKSHDEVGRIWSEFLRTAEKIDSLERGRELFLRNILHELRTPITKGKLALALLEQREQRRETEILNLVFNRLDSLLGEMVNIERLVSRAGNQQPMTKGNLKNVIEEAIKLGFIDINKIEISGDGDAYFDHSLLSIGFKNLIDNGIKYSENNKIKIKIIKNKIYFISKGDKLNKNWDEYIKPFNHSQITSKRGFGLGLYITNEIALKHDWLLIYKYICGHNIFILNIK